MRQLIRRLLYLVRQRALEADLAEEMHFHREMKQRELERDGMSQAEAALAARREIGNVTLAREDARAVWIWPWLESVWQDPRHADRLGDGRLRPSPPRGTRRSDGRAEVRIGFARFAEVCEPR